MTPPPFNDKRSVDILRERTKPTDPGPGEETIIIGAALSSPRLPAALRVSIGLCFLVCSTGVLVALVVLYWKYLSDPLLKAAAISAIIACAFWSVLKAYRRHQAVAQARDDLSKAIDHLRAVSQRLAEYRHNFDTRTSKYFNCITSGKMHTYFTLSQLQDAIAKRITRIDQLLHSPSRRNVAAAHRLLYSELTYSDGATAVHGTKRAVPIAQLEPLLVETIEILDREISELEAEIHFE